MGSSQVLFDDNGICPYYSASHAARVSHKQMSVSEIKSDLYEMFSYLHEINPTAKCVITIITNCV